eukprot:COSAG01_NODE_445_length_16991_cov_24.504262_6_plen_229_part_00
MYSSDDGGGDGGRGSPSVTMGAAEGAPAAPAEVDDVGGGRVPPQGADRRGGGRGREWVKRVAGWRGDLLSWQVLSEAEGAEPINTTDSALEDDVEDKVAATSDDNDDDDDDDDDDDESELDDFADELDSELAAELVEGSALEGTSPNMDDLDVLRVSRVCVCVCARARARACVFMSIDWLCAGATPSLLTGCENHAAAGWLRPGCGSPGRAGPSRQSCHARAATGKTS